jgi:hypothetical protein
VILRILKKTVVGSGALPVQNSTENEKCQDALKCFCPPERQRFAIVQGDLFAVSAQNGIGDVVVLCVLHSCGILINREGHVFVQRVTVLVLVEEVPKGMSAYTRDALGNGQALQIRAVPKGIIVDFYQTFRQDNALQFGKVRE